jgi:hypothetical protein
MIRYFGPKVPCFRKISRYPHAIVGRMIDPLTIHQTRIVNACSRVVTWPTRVHLCQRVSTLLASLALTVTAVISSP